jgi:two-component system response regulator AtoC
LNGATVLVVDDEPAVRFAVAEVLRDRGFEVLEAEHGVAALSLLERAEAVVSDIAMPVMDGLQLLREVRAKAPWVPVVLLTARGSERLAVQAMKDGAADYLAKPFDIDELVLAVERALESASLKRESRRAAAERALGRGFVAESAAMKALMVRVERLARRDVPVLVRGATGTGKEHIATLLHALSGRVKGPLVRFNAAALPTELAESELFGHARGAFTGAQGARQGFFARADRGTLVIDEVGELSPALQPKLLRALQNGEIQPVGAGRTETVDVRVVACTNRDLLAEARAGRFREDLYYRLAVVELEVPPLAARRDDIAPLARLFANRAAERFGLDEVRLSDRLVDALVTREWPGNVRELENALSRLVADSEGGLIDTAVAQSLGLSNDAPMSGAAPGGTAARSEAHETEQGAGPEGIVPLRARLEALERRLVEDALAGSNNNRAEAARRLGLSRVTLLDRMKRLGIG